ncbi:MAG TPA: sugar phosphate isomerase/epimerase family protein [Gaiellaceae bacterium]|jgi:sugar phosphate isomerase/epimerase|nr:sugar phosphate isomerase/epimerase family protein [Gaiellaceae bacterium]
MKPITFMTANYVARETGYPLTDWGVGDRTTNAAFAPVETFAERFGVLLDDIRTLGFDAIDLWSAHLNPEWATEKHIASARDALDRRGMSVVSYASAVTPANVEPVCELASALGVTVLTGGFSSETEALAPTLERHGVRLGIENHPEKTPAELLEKIERGGPMFGATVDTGWWGTQGYDAAEAIEELRDHLVHVHLKDVRAPGGHDTCRWGEGVVPVEACVRTLQRLDYAGPLSVEHEPMSFDPSDDARAMRSELEGWLA